MLLFWIGVAIAAVVIELITPTALVSIWFACGAVIALLLELASAGLEVQIFAFVVISLVTMVIVRPIATRYLRGNVVATNADRMINEIGVVTKAISLDTWGEVRIKGTLWSAVSIDSTDIATGKKVKIIAIEGAKLIVREIDEG